MLNLEDEAVERRIHEVLKAAWPLVNQLFVSNSAKNEVGPLALSPIEDLRGRGVDMIFALQTAWPFIHDSKDTVLKRQAALLLRHESPNDDLPAKTPSPKFG